MLDYSTSVRIDAPAEMVKTWLAKAVKGLQWPYGKHPTSIMREKPRSETTLQARGWWGDRYRMVYAVAYESKKDPEIWNVQIMDADALLVDATALAAERTRLDLQWSDLVHALVLDLLAAMATDYPETMGQLYPAEPSPSTEPDPRDDAGGWTMPDGLEPTDREWLLICLQSHYQRHGIGTRYKDFCQQAGLNHDTYNSAKGRLKKRGYDLEAWVKYGKPKALRKDVIRAITDNQAEPWKDSQSTHNQLTSETPTGDPETSLQWLHD